MLAEAVRDELVERNVASIVRGPRIDHEEVRPWSRDEAATFLAAASTHRLSALFAVGVAMGLRRGELLALAWDDVDLDGGILRVRRTVQRLTWSRASVWAAEVEQVASEHPITGVLARGAAVPP
jgi:integrase